jgi:hypothetical protein
VHTGVGSVLQPLFDSYGARPTYLLSPEVIMDERAASTLEGLVGRAELGTHLHREFLAGDPASVRDTRALESEQTAATESEDLEALTRLFRNRFGRAPRAYRAGRFAVSGRTIRVLDELGYSVDSSVTPGKLWDVGLDFVDAPSDPYTPSREDIRVPGSGTVLEIPVTLRARRIKDGLQERLGPVGRRTPFRQAARRLSSPVWFRPGWTPASTLRRLVRDCGEAGGDKVLNMMFHNVDVLPGMSPNAGGPAQAARVVASIEVTLQECARVGARFATLSEIAEWWRPRA